MRQQFGRISVQRLTVRFHGMRVGDRGDLTPPFTETEKQTEHERTHEQPRRHVDRNGVGLLRGPVALDIDHVKLKAIRFVANTVMHIE